MTNQEIAEAIFKQVGPAANITKAENCMTRLRLELAQQPKAIAELKAIPGVLGVLPTATGVQVVLGPGKAGQVCTLFKQIMTTMSNNPSEDQPTPAATEPATANSSSEQKTGAEAVQAISSAATEPSQPQVGDGKALHAAIKAKNATRLNSFLQRLARIFVPLIPAFIGCGLVTGLLNVLLKFEPALAGLATIQILKVAGNAVFWGLNLFVGVNAAKEFGGSPILGGVMAAILTHPALANIDFMGTSLVPGRGGIIAVLLVAAFTAYLERYLRRLVPEILDLFVTPFLVILIATFVALGLLQPLGGWLSEAIGASATTAIHSGGALTGFVLGGTFLPLVMTGLHQGLVPIHAELLSRSGVTILLPILAMAGAGQVGAALAVYAKTKNPQVKHTVASALPVGFMGIGEPLIYGVTLPLGKPFIGACIGGAFGGAVQAFFAVGATSIGLSGLPLAASTDASLHYLLGLLVAYVVGFGATYVIGFNDPV